MHRQLTNYKLKTKIPKMGMARTCLARDAQVQSLRTPWAKSSEARILQKGACGPTFWTAMASEPLTTLWKRSWVCRTETSLSVSQQLSSSSTSHETIVAVLHFRFHLSEFLFGEMRDQLNKRMGLSEAQLGLVFTYKSRTSL